MRNNEKRFTIQKITNSKSKVAMRISFLSFVIIFCLLLTMINEDPIIVPSEGSVLSIEDDIPILELNVTTHESLTSQDMEKGEIMFFYYIEINKPSLYKLTLTMPPEVYEVRAEFWKITKNNYGDPRSSHIENLYYYVGGITTTSSQNIVFSKNDFNNNIGLTLILKSNKNSYFDRSFSVKFTEDHIAQTDKVVTMLTDNVRDINSYFILDQSKLNVEEAGFYYLSTTLTIAASTGIGSFNGWMNIHCINPEKEFYLYYNWGSPDIIGQTDIIYLDPEIDYYFEIDSSWWTYEEGYSIALTLQLFVDPVIQQVLSINESTSIESGLNFIKVAIPLRDSVKLTLSQNAGSNYDLKIISRLNTRNYGTFYSNGFYTDIYDDDNSYQINTQQFSYLQLARRAIDTSLAYLYNWPNDASHIWFGGLVETYEYEYSTNNYFSSEKRINTWTDGGLMFDNEDYIYLRINLFDSSGPMTLNSEIVSLNDDLPYNTSIDLTKDDPIQIYEFSGSKNSLYSFQYQSFMSVNEPSIFEDEDFDYNGLSTSFTLDTSVLLPGIVTPIFSSNKDFQLFSILNGYSILVYAPSYSINSYGRLLTPRDQIIDVDEIRTSIAEALITTTVIKDSIPTVGNLIDITINATQEIFWFSLVVEENVIYSVELEAHPFFRDDVEVRIIDTNGLNPFFGNNVINSNSGSMSGIKTVLIGRKNSQCYLSLKGYGLVRLHIEKLGSVNNNPLNFPLNANAIFGIILILGMTTFFTARLFTQKK